METLVFVGRNMSDFYHTALRVPAPYGSTGRRFDGPTDMVAILQRSHFPDGLVCRNVASTGVFVRLRMRRGFHKHPIKIE
jgi:hypothetical protein